jgi:hypothetical protein
MGQEDALRGWVYWLVELCMAIVSIVLCSQLTTRGRKLLP